MAVTLKDVAREVGVSPMVVSKVLHGRAATVRVSEATAARVRAAAVSLGYQPNPVARSLRLGRTQMLAFVGSDLQAFPSFAAAAHRHGYVAAVPPFAPRESRQDGSPVDPALQDARFDGYVRIGMSPIAPTKPTITLVPESEDLVGIAVADLAGKGHRRIAFVSGTRESETSRPAFFAALTREGVSGALPDAADAVEYAAMLAMDAAPHGAAIVADRVAGEAVARTLAALRRDMPLLALYPAPMVPCLVPLTSECLEASVEALIEAVR